MSENPYKKRNVIRGDEIYDPLAIRAIAIENAAHKAWNEGQQSAEKRLLDMIRAQVEVMKIIVNVYDSSTARACVQVTEKLLSEFTD